MTTTHVRDRREEEQEEVCDEQEEEAAEGEGLELTQTPCNFQLCEYTS